MNVLTNNLRKTYASLASVKGRKETGLFMAQGNKCVMDTIEYFQLEALLANDVWISEHKKICQLYSPTLVKNTDLQKISTLTTAPEVIAIYQIPDIHDFTIGESLTLALDGVRDPGNLGTIMRVADWMGVRNILASTDSVDVWNPKVVQATMGAISRVSVRYCDLRKTLSKVKVPVYGTFMRGENIYKADLRQNGVIVMGNEGKGISDAVASCVTDRLTIPSYPPNAPTSESLNVAIATAITLSEFRRRI